MTRQHHSMLTILSHQPRLQFSANSTSTHDQLQPCLRSLLWLPAGLWLASPSSALPLAASWPPRSRRPTSTRAPSRTLSSTYDFRTAIDLYSIPQSNTYVSRFCSVSCPVLSCSLAGEYPLSHPSPDGRARCDVHDHFVWECGNLSSNTLRRLGLERLHN
jgi:hypothetical protein